MQMRFEYTDIKTEGCEGWINLFFGGWCVAMIKDVELAENIKATTPKLGSASDEQHEARNEECPACLGEGFNAIGETAGKPCGICGATGRI